jgi:hypothetical protein
VARADAGRALAAARTPCCPPTCARARAHARPPAPAASGDVRHNGLDSRDGSQDSVEEEQERLQAAVELIAEMQLTAEQLRQGLRAAALAPGFGREFRGEQPAGEAEAAVREVAREYSARLRDRAAAELPMLPFERRAPPSGTVGGGAACRGREVCPWGVVWANSKSRRSAGAPRRGA